MKLLMCTECQDIFNLSPLAVRQCSCGQVKGAYIDELNAWYYGTTAVPLGLINNELVQAIRKRPPGHGPGVTFTAFVIPHQCETFIQSDTPDGPVGGH